jgi:hypothetical protein
MIECVVAMIICGERLYALLRITQEQKVLY